MLFSPYIYPHEYSNYDLIDILNEWSLEDERDYIRDIDNILRDREATLVSEGIPSDSELYNIVIRVTLYNFVNDLYHIRQNRP